jgi:hypothetical protein
MPVSLPPDSRHLAPDTRSRVFNNFWGYPFIFENQKSEAGGQESEWCHRLTDPES